MNNQLVILFFFIFLSFDLTLLSESNETIPEGDEIYYEPRFKLPPDTGKY